MQRKVKSNSVITHAISEDGNVLTFSVVGAGEVKLDRTRVHETLRDRAEIHGLFQRVSDGGAISRNADTGRPASPADKLARMTMIAEHLMGGGTEWAMKATGERAAPDAGLIVLAICRAITRGNIDEANLAVDNLATKRGITRSESLRVWAGTDKVLAEIAKIKAERAPSGADDLLDEIEGM